jgi:hypothetical protein
MACLCRKSGSEGPSYDPWAYDEITFTNAAKQAFTIRVGLGHRVREGQGAYKVLDQAKAERWWLQKTGLTMPQTARLLERLEHPSRCHKCGSKRLHSDGGYPGETLLICSMCSSICASYLNMRAIE